ncbi:mannonate dehydratase, partial [Salmonella enterica subsp. enterica serovar Montevideo]|nr:mannonate dehydratase [Salmonella enterica subsp. enterica serovar Montevideo]
MIKQFGPRIYFTHLRSTLREENPKTFHEAAHLHGDVDMYEVVSPFLKKTLINFTKPNVMNITVIVYFIIFRIASILYTSNSTRY